MPTFTFNVKVDNTKKVLNALPKVVDKTLNEIGDAAIKHTQAKVPIDTGALRDSYLKDVDVQNKKLRVGSPLAYAPFVELGTGPNYEKPPDWITNNAVRGHHAIDPWWYFDDDDGEWHLGWFVRARPHLRPAFIDNIKEYINIFRDNLKNA